MLNLFSGFVAVRIMKMEKKIEVAMVTNHFVISGIGIVIMNYREALDIRKYDLTILAGQTIAGKIGKGMSKNGMTC